MTTAAARDAGTRAKRVRNAPRRRTVDRAQSATSDATTSQGRAADAPDTAPTSDAAASTPSTTSPAAAVDDTSTTSTTSRAAAVDDTSRAASTPPGGRGRGTRGTADQAAPTPPPAAADAPEALTLAALKPDPHNRRKHPDRNLALIVDALQHVGAARSIVIDEHNEILAGNGVVQAARTQGLTKLQVVEADGDTLIAVRRRGLTIAQKRELAIYDNRTGELAEWNADQLDIDFKAGLNFAPFFTDQELAKLLPDNDDAQPTSIANPDPQYLIIVTCTDEVQQTEVLEQLLKDGLDCRAVVS
jgi:hypothetical protein